MGKRGLVALLSLSSWYLVIVVWLFLVIPRICLQFVIVVFPDDTHLLFSLLNKRNRAIIFDCGITVSRRCFFCRSFMLFLSCFVMLSHASVY